MLRGARQQNLHQLQKIRKKKKWQRTKKKKKTLRLLTTGDGGGGGQDTLLEAHDIRVQKYWAYRNQGRRINGRRGMRPSTAQGRSMVKNMGKNRNIRMEKVKEGAEKNLQEKTIVKSGSGEGSGQKKKTYRRISGKIPALYCGEGGGTEKGK